MFPKMGPLQKQMLISKSLLWHILQGSGVPRNFFRGGSTNSVEDRENGDLGEAAP
jgi:hypothetical protein